MFLFPKYHSILEISLSNVNILAELRPSVISVFKIDTIFLMSGRILGLFYGYLEYFFCTAPLMNTRNQEMFTNFANAKLFNLKS